MIFLGKAFPKPFPKNFSFFSSAISEKGLRKKRNADFRPSAAENWKRFSVLFFFTRVLFHRLWKTGWKI